MSEHAIGGAADFSSDELPDLDSILRLPEGAVPFGLQTALKEEIEKGDAILNGAPSDATPLDVMRYLEAIRDV